MTVWRIAPDRYLKDLLRGEGGLYAAGRWHERGVPILYASDHPSTAALELLVNASAAKLSASTYRIVQLHVPDDSVYFVAEESLAQDWRRHPHPDSTRTVGMRWLRDNRSLVLDVPSAVLPVARNIVINPRHARIDEVRITSTESLRFDERLVRRD